MTLSHPTPPITLGTAGQYDPDALAALLALAAPTTASARAAALPSAATLHGMIERDDLLLNLSPVALSNGEAVGVALVGERPAPAAQRRVGGAGCRGWLAALAVAPSWQRSGVGRLLLRHVIRTAQTRQWTQLTLLVAADNAPARHLYDAHEFVALRRLHGYMLACPVPAVRADHSVLLRPMLAPLGLALYDACAAANPAGAHAPWPVEVLSLARLASPGIVYQIVERDPGEAGGQPAGYLAVAPTGEAGGSGLALLGLGIVPGARRRGLGHAALAALGTLYPAVTALHLAALVPETSALTPFLHACGARRSGSVHIEMGRGV